MAPLLVYLITQEQIFVQANNFWKPNLNQICHKTQIQTRKRQHPLKELQNGGSQSAQLSQFS